MKYQCQNPECKKTFMHTAKLTIQALPQETVLLIDSMLSEAPMKDPDVRPLVEIFTTLRKTLGDGTFEVYVCPHCRSKIFSEFIEPLPVPVQEAVSNVYIHDLTSGAQTALDALLAQGYKIQQRYAKQYFLEKPKAGSSQESAKEAS